MNQVIYKTIFILLILSLFTARVELSFVLAIISCFLAFKSKIDRKLFHILTFLSALFFIGIFGIFKLDDSLAVYIKDVVYYFRPILVALSSYFLIKKISDKQFFFNSIIVLGLLFAIQHVFKITTNISSLNSIIEIRIKGGRYNHVVLFAFIFFILKKDNILKKKFGSFTNGLFFIILAVSFLLYFSRVMFLVFLIYILAYKGYFRFTKRGVYAVLIGIVFTTFFMLIINQFQVDSNSDGVGGFVFKIQNTYNEIFESLDIDKIKLDKRELWKHWRGYEAQCAIDELNEAGKLSWAIGMGFGSTVDLGLEVGLANETIQFIPILHNGFIYVLYKTGIIGLFIYLLYMLYLYGFYKASFYSKKEFEINRFIVGCTFYIAISSLVVTGIYKPYDLSSLLVGGLIALKTYYNENRDIRD